MGPGETFAFIAAVAGMAGTTITLAVSWMRHRERMVGVLVKNGGRVHDTVAMLTETLERQHDRQQALAQRLDALETARTAPLGAFLTDDADGQALVPATSDRALSQTRTPRTTA